MQVILLGSYFGSSDFVYRVSCTGRLLDIVEVNRLGLTDPDAQRQHSRSHYTQDWYEVKPGDQIEIEIWGADYGEGNHHYRFTIPPQGLTDPPQTLEDLTSTRRFARTAPRIHEYLKSQCPTEELPLESSDDE